MYNERIYDLINDGVPPLEGWRHLELKEDSHGCVFIEGLNEACNGIERRLYSIECHCLEELVFHVYAKDSAGVVLEVNGRLNECRSRYATQSKA